MHSKLFSTLAKNMNSGLWGSVSAALCKAAQPPISFHQHNGGGRSHTWTRVRGLDGQLEPPPGKILMLGGWRFALIFTQAVKLRNIHQGVDYIHGEVGSLLQTSPLNSGFRLST